MIDDEKKEDVKDSDGGTGEGEAGPKDSTGEGSEEGGEAAPTTPAGDGILRDPRTGEPLRDQTPAAKDTGYLGQHSMQDDTESISAPESPEEADFKE